MGAWYVDDGLDPVGDARPQHCGVARDRGKHGADRRQHDRLQRAARIADPGLGRRLHRRDRHQGRPSATASDTELGNQIVPGGRRVAGRRVPHRELARHGAGRERRAVRAGRPGDARPGARSSTGRRPGRGPASRPAPRSSPTTRRCCPPPSCPRRCSTSRTPSGRAAGPPRRRGADFQAIVSALLALKGEDATRPGWPGMKDNSLPTRATATVMKAVNAGEIPAGVIYHYYWFGDQAKTGENSKQRRAALLQEPGPGRLRQRLRRRRAEVQPERGRRAGVPEVHHRRERARRSSRPALVRVRDRQRRRRPTRSWCRSTQLEAPTIDPSTLDSTRSPS